MKVIIKKASKKDAEELLNLQQTALWEPGFMLENPDEWHHTVKDEEDDIKTRQKGNNLYLIAQLDSQIVGFLRFTGGKFAKTSHAGKFGMFVRKEFRGMGVGKKLIKELLIWAKNNKIKRVELEVLANNKPALGLYKKSGFKKEGVKKKESKINNKYLDSIIMAKLLS